ncbi:MAG: hypothetical protein AB7F43_04835 [Bacteriovoracia bacterium]
MKILNFILIFSVFCATVIVSAEPVKTNINIYSNSQSLDKRKITWIDTVVNEDSYLFVFQSSQTDFNEMWGVVYDEDTLPKENITILSENQVSVEIPRSKIPTHASFIFLHFVFGLEDEEISTVVTPLGLWDRNG